MKVSELLGSAVPIQLDEMGIFGKQVRIKENAGGSAADFAGKVGKIVNISADYTWYYIQFHNKKEWIRAKEIEGVKMR